MFPHKYGFYFYNLRSFKMEIIKNASNLEWFQNQSFSLNGFYHPVFTTMPTASGMGYTFNLMDADKIFNFNL